MMKNIKMVFRLIIRITLSENTSNFGSRGAFLGW